MLCHSDASVLKYTKVFKQLYTYKKIITYYVAILSVRLFVKKFSLFLNHMLWAGMGSITFKINQLNYNYFGY